MAAAVLGVAAALGPAGLLELVEQQDAVVGVQHQRLAEVLLARRGALVQVAEHQELAQPHAEQLLRARAVHGLGEVEDEGERAWAARHAPKGTTSDENPFHVDHHCANDDLHAMAHRRRTPPLGRAGRRMPRTADGGARRDDRERRAAADAGRPPLLPGEPHLGGRRLHDRLRLASCCWRAGSATSSAASACSSPGSCCSSPPPPPAGWRRTRRR